MTASDGRAWGAVLGAALVLRLAVGLAWAAPVVGDAADYDRLASGLADGRGYVDTRGEPTAWRPPGYPAFLAGVYRTLGRGPRAIGVVQALVGTATVAATGALAAAVLGAPAGLTAAALTAVDVAQLSLTSRRLSEGLCTLLLALLLLTVLGLSRALRDDARTWGWALVAGVLGALVTLTRGLFVGLPVVLAAAVVVEGVFGRAPRDPGVVARGSGGAALAGTRGRGRRALAAAALLLAAYGVALVPWTLRNARALGAAVPVATQGGITLYASWFPPGSAFGVFPDDAVTRGAGGLSEPEQSRYFVAATEAGLRGDPGRIPRLLALKALYLAVPLDWEVLPRYGGVNPTYLVAAGWALAFFVALGAGLRRAAWPLWLPLLYVVALALVFYGSPRLRAPVDPLLACLAGGGVAELARRRGGGRAGALLGASAAAALGVAALGVPLKAWALDVLRRVGVWRS